MYTGQHYIVYFVYLSYTILFWFVCLHCFFVLHYLH